MAYFVDRSGQNWLSGTGNADRMYGLDGKDKLVGDGGDDSLYGGDGADELRGQSGNDYLVGGAGKDTAAFSGQFSEYEITRSGNDYIVTDLNLNNGNDGTDTLHDIEKIMFGNKAYILGDFEEVGRTTLLADSINTNEMWSGSGNTITNFTIVENDDAGVELALKAKIRQGPDIVPTGDTYVAPTGPQDDAHGSQADNAGRAAWSFDFSVNGDTDNNGLPSGFIFQLEVDVDKGAGTKFATVYKGTIAGSSGQFADGFNGDGTVVDNSQNYVFFTSLFPASSPYNMNDEGTYEIRLSAFDAKTLLATTTIKVEVTDDF